MPGFYYSASGGSSGERYPVAGLTTYYNADNGMTAYGYRSLASPDLTYVQNLDGTLSAYTRTWGSGDPSTAPNNLFKSDHSI